MSKGVGRWLSYCFSPFLLLVLAPFLLLVLLPLSFRCLPAHVSWLLPAHVCWCGAGSEDRVARDCILEQDAVLLKGATWADWRRPDRWIFDEVEHLGHEEAAVKGGGFVATNPAAARELED